MDVADIITILDLHGFEDSEEEDKVAVINDALFEICTREPWPFLEAMVDLDEGDIDTVGKVTMPAGPALGSVLDILNTSVGGNLAWVRRDQHFKTNSLNLTDAGEPSRYFFVGDDLYVWPVPTAATSLRLTFLQLQEALDADSVEADILLPARHHRLIALGAILKLNAQEDDPENFQLFQSQYEEKMALLRQDVYKKQWDRPDSIQVMDEDDWEYDV